MEENKKQIRYKNLSPFLKMASIGGFIYFVVACLAFAAGFYYGFYGLI